MPEASENPRDAIMTELKPTFQTPPQSRRASYAEPLETSILSSPVVTKKFKVPDQRACLYALIVETYGQDTHLDTIIKDAEAILRDVVTESPPSTPTPVVGSGAFVRIKEERQPDVKLFVETVAKAHQKRLSVGKGRKSIKRRRRQPRKRRKGHQGKYFTLDSDDEDFEDETESEDEDEDESSMYSESTSLSYVTKHRRRWKKEKGHEELS